MLNLTLYLNKRDTNTKSSWNTISPTASTRSDKEYTHVMLWKSTQGLIINYNMRTILSYDKSPCSVSMISWGKKWREWHAVTFTIVFVIIIIIVTYFPSWSSHMLKDKSQPADIWEGEGKKTVRLMRDKGNEKRKERDRDMCPQTYQADMFSDARILNSCQCLDWPIVSI